MSIGVWWDEPAIGALGCVNRQEAANIAESFYSPYHGELCQCNSWKVARA
jgi:hypothetical protein